MMRPQVRSVFLLIVMLCLAGVTFAQGEITATLIDTLNVRSGPGADQPVIAMLPIHSTVVVEGRNKVGNWALVHTPDGAVRGWVATRYLVLPDSVDIGVLPIVDAQVSAPQQAAPPPANTNAPPAGEIIGTSVTLLNVRTAPGAQNAAINTIARGVQVVVEGRNKVGDWLLVHTPDGAVRGWVATRYLVLPDSLDLGSLPIVEEQVAPAVSNAESPQAGDEEALLSSIPVIPAISGTARQIYLRGQAMGNHAHVIAKIGDCNTENYAFLSPLDAGNYDLGPYGDLQPTIDFFKGSFSLDSVAGRTGYSALTVLDSTWADPKVCLAGESSVYCELRRHHASIAIIMFGSNDIFTLTADQYEQSIREIVRLSIAHGTIPVLTTFTNSRALGPKWQTLLDYNAITVKVAQDNDIPLINFWRAAQALPNGGISGDLAHLTYSGSPRVSFHGEETQAGFSLRNLVTLQTLDAIRKAAMG